ncbi:cyclic-phosphate processing receiver domain-containing protein [Leeia aquatica]|uniref:cyclic-phosphate processing receiver domain-containing protein n=1 Tax=Leeia aquatica TaxID=2725557 RepID=UPI00197EB9D4|nr:cyclic-phosphate processing receiver domain-containing protein [Leeia aquatica]
MPIRIFLDDERATPAGWVRAWWPDEVITLLQTCEVAEVSLDHDLGDDQRGTGYDVIRWIEEAVALRGYRPPRLHVHSANPPARARMLRGIAAIEALATRLPDDTPPG